MDLISIRRGAGQIGFSLNKVQPSYNKHPEPALKNSVACCNCFLSERASKVPPRGRCISTLPAAELPAACRRWNSRGPASLKKAQGGRIVLGVKPWPQCPVKPAPSYIGLPHSLIRSVSLHDSTPIRL